MELKDKLRNIRYSLKGVNHLPSLGHFKLKVDDLGTKIHQLA